NAAPSFVPMPGSPGSPRPAGASARERSPTGRRCPPTSSWRTPMRARSTSSCCSRTGPRRRRPPPRPGRPCFCCAGAGAPPRGRTPGRAHHNVLFGAGDYDAEFDAVFGRPGRPVTDPAVYISAPDDRTVCPVGHEAWFVLVNAPRHGIDGTRGALNWDSAGLASGYEGRVLSLLTARGLPVRERLVFRKVLAPADLQRRTGAPGGAIYGAALHGLLGSVRRPANTAKVRGLYLVGGSTQPGGGLPLVAQSAKIVANLIGPS